MKPGEAVVFDLYGTLLHLRDKAFSRGGARVFGASRGEWASFLRDTLLVRAFADVEELIAAALDRFAPPDREAARRQAAELIERELGAIRPEPALRSVLGFLRRRGCRLGLLTNSASPYRAPAERLGVIDAVDVAVFSCEEGRRKPDPEIYRGLLAALEVPAERAIMVGDSLANDVEAPRELGMRAVRLGGPGRGGPAIASFAELAWVAEVTSDGLVLLIEDGAPVRLQDRSGRLRRLDLLPDERQGRYNLVASGEAQWSDGSSERIYVKRFRHPESALVEVFVRRLLGELGIEACPAALIEGPELLLLAAEAHGRALQAGPPEPRLAHELGRHSAAAFLLANADQRPHNTLLGTGPDGAPRLTVIDYEFTLFDRAIDLSAEPDRYDPASLARIPDDELRGRGAKRVVSRASVRRSLRTFFDVRRTPPASLEAFRGGWHEVHRSAQRAAPRLEELLRSRLRERPPLVIGTANYRRALLPLDVDDLLERVALDPDRACDLCF